MSEAQAEIAPATIFQAEHIVADHRPASAGLPQFTWMQGRQVELLPNRVHFAADNVHDSEQRPLAEKKIGIDSGGKLADVSGAHQEFVASDFGVCRRLAQSRDKQS